MTGAVPRRASPPTIARRDADHDAASLRDAAAFGDFVVRHRRKLRGHCQRLLGSTLPDALLGHVQTGGDC
ncbi:MAG TPA: hypothetical protein VFI46_07200 [Jiangellaceae bacterium]|nr:hypothetical protein [Jiangellaceae bacterium]